MVYQKTNWNPYDETKSEQENIENNAVVTAEKMNHLEDGLVAHENDKSNIHAVTAAQTGAYTKKETDDKFVPQTQTATSTQAGILKVVNNFVTTDSLSALSANAGKLLNDKLTIITQGNIEAAKKPSEFNDGITISQGHKAQGFPQDYNTIITYKLNPNRVTQWLFPKDINAANYSILIRGVSAQDLWGSWDTIPLGSAVVNLSEDQTIGGIKNFTAMPKLNGVDLLEDTGWQPLTPNSGYTWVSGYPVQYRKVGSIVYLRGRVTNNATMGAVANLPAGLRTPRQLYFTVSVAATGADAIGKYTIDTNGDITLRSATTTNYPTVLDNVYYFVD